MNEQEITQNNGSGTAMSLVMDIHAMDKMTSAAKIMASAKVTIPAHLRNSEGDCMAVIMQAAQWGMNPFTVAQKTHLTQGGALGYEAQLINAVIVSCGAIKGQPDFEFIGNWEKILGKVKEMKSEKSGGKYYVADWNSNDEEGLGVRVFATLRGEDKPREIIIMLSQCYPRFSTQWATDPQQQITYVAVRKFARRYAPGAILGVYAPEELGAPQTEEREINPVQTVKQDEKPKQKPLYSETDFAKNFPAWTEAILSGKHTPEAVINRLQTKADLTDVQKAKIRAIENIAEIQIHDAEEAAPSQTSQATNAPTITYAQIADKINAATDADILDAHADLISQIGDKNQQNELREMYKNRKAKLAK